MGKTFTEKLLAAQMKNSSCVCVGLDPDKKRILSDGDKGGVAKRKLGDFCKRIIKKTAAIACAFKLNFGFYLNFVPGDPAAGIEVLGRIIKFIEENYPDIPIILDYKAGDIGNSALQYAEAAFSGFGVDAVTINDYLGSNSVFEFLKLGFAFGLCKTSNPSSGEFQDFPETGTTPVTQLYQRVAELSAEWRNEYPESGIVFGATYPEQLAEICGEYPDMPMLLPGIGKQEGDLEATIEAVAGNNAEDRPFVINSSRGIIYADDPDIAARTLCHKINKLLPDGFYG